MRAMNTYTKARVENTLLRMKERRERLEREAKANKKENEKNWKNFKKNTWQMIKSVV